MSNSNLKIKIRIPTDYQIEFTKWIPNSDNFLHFIIDNDVECVIYFSNENIKENNDNGVNPATRKPLSFNEILTNDLICLNEISFILILKNHFLRNIDVFIASYRQVINVWLYGLSAILYYISLLSYF